MIFEFFAVVYGKVLSGKIPLKRRWQRRLMITNSSSLRLLVADLIIRELELHSDLQVKLRNNTCKYVSLHSITMKIINDVST